MSEIVLPWGAWYGDRELELSVPSDWQITNYALSSNKKISTEQIQLKIKSITSALKQKKPGKIIIVVDDLTRPVLLDELMRSLLEAIHHAGVEPEQIKILIGLGSHQGLSKESLIKKLGAHTVASYNCLNHDPADTVPIDVIWGKTAIKLNRHYVEADFKIVISGLTPHSFAGFSGGAKMLFPGLTDMDTIAKTHKSVLMGFMGKLGDMARNKFRDTIEEFVHKAGLDFFIGVVINGDRSMRNIYCGDYIAAHRQAAEEARAYYLQQEKDNGSLYDALILNAYPKDTELLQAENGFIPLKSSPGNMLKENGIVVLTSACSEGVGHHGLFGVGGVLYRKPRPLRFLKKHPLIFFSENVTGTDFYSYYHESYEFVNSSRALVERLKDALPEQARIAVFPYGSLQLTG